jgi:cytoskeletal protein RodZ
MMSLEALERSDLTRLPGGIFTRAFVRAYAKEVGLDPDRTIQEFVAELPPEAAAVNSRTAMIEEGARLESDRQAATTAIRLALVSAPIIGLVIYYGGSRTPTVPDVSAVPVVEAEMPAPPAVQEPAVSASVAEAVPAPTGLRMDIAPRASCWVSVTADGERVFSGMMAAGEARSVVAKEQILVSVGDAGAFAYTLNGRPGRALGAPGDVVSTRITPSNLSEFIAP